MLWYYGVILMPLIVGIVLVLVLVLEASVLVLVGEVLVLVLVLEATVLETSLINILKFCPSFRLIYAAILMRMHWGCKTRTRTLESQKPNLYHHPYTGNEGRGKILLCAVSAENRLVGNGMR